jgi:metal-responsive CopG/Arc/MetJ family transcriptional regulator
MAQKRYVSISIPEDLANRVDEILKEGDWGFRTRAEIVNEALREFVLRLKSTD